MVLFAIILWKAIELLKLMLEKGPEKRIKAAEALEHPYLIDATRFLDDSLEEIDYIEEHDEHNHSVHKKMMEINEE
jgi:serine/threonine protein kinase